MQQAEGKRKARESFPGVSEIDFHEHVRAHNSKINEDTHFGPFKLIKL